MLQLLSVYTPRLAWVLPFYVAVGVNAVFLC